ncbi:MAG: DNA topoisomerase I [SAR86 cluster bacterium]|uniref:DNA topoisomerase I n=1 Tax=SAR86 cluster bacterium TaxID=2030880 RepID=A0A2A4MW85_9GAMM|nr:MAG: DNA topoisomerase I [SAR86 cluster bacterium]
MSDSKAAAEKTYYCPQCKSNMRRIIGKMGPFWGCSDFPKCKATLFDVEGKPSTELDEHYRCPLCTRRMAKSSQDKGNYWYCTGYTKGCKTRLKDNDGRPEDAYLCRSCSHLLTQRKGKNGLFWGCSQYPQCTQTYNDTQGRPDFDLLSSKNP